MPSSSRHHSSQSAPQSSLWQERLEEACREYNIQAPSYQVVSDRRGGRTAWSTIIMVYGKRIDARFWYDGKHIHNSKEDAAEAALNWLANSSGLSTGW